MSDERQVSVSVGSGLFWAVVILMIFVTDACGTKKHYLVSDCAGSRCEYTVEAR